MPRRSRKKLQKKETSSPNPKKHLEYEVSQGGVVRENTLPVRPPNVTQISIFYCSHRWYRRPMIGPSIETKTGGMWGCQGWQVARTWVLVSPEMVGFPTPIRPPGASQSTGAQKGTKGKWKSPWMPKFEQKPMKVCANRIALQTCNQSA